MAPQTHTSRTQIPRAPSGDEHVMRKAIGEDDGEEEEEDGEKEDGEKEDEWEE